jgi:aminomuconate-semialdehyde/2-hydroxymuconate-6-semialdehyde dehydrogenase
MKRLLNLIGGEWKAPMAQTWFSRENPSTGEPHAEVPDSDLMEVVQAVQAANQAFQAWQKLEKDERPRLLNGIAARLEAKLEALSRLQCADTGILLVRARAIVAEASALFRARAAELDSGLVQNEAALKARVKHERLPIGLVGILTPSSDALSMMASRVSAALAAGNAVILKPSELAPLTAQAFSEIVLEALQETGLPAGIFNLVQGRGEQAGMALVQHPGISTLAFAGRTENGRRVLAASAEFLKKTHLALGGRNPVLVFADSNFEELMPLLKRIALGTDGPACLRGSRFFVQESAYKRFLELFEATIASTVIGDPCELQTELGPLISAGDKKRFQEAVAQASREKGKELLPHERREESLARLPISLGQGHFMAPAVSYDLTLCSTLQQEEIPGPFVSVASFKYLHEAVKHANNSPLGLAAYVFHGDEAKAMRVASQIAAGRIFVGGGARDVDAFSFGGVKQSGLGLEGGDELVRFFSRETLIAY